MFYWCRGHVRPSLAGFGQSWVPFHQSGAMLDQNKLTSDTVGSGATKSGAIFFQIRPVSVKFGPISFNFGQLPADLDVRPCFDQVGFLSAQFGLESSTLCKLVDFVFWAKFTK